MISHGATECTEPSLEKVNAITERVIGCAIEVHRQLELGLLESIYEAALCIELERTGIGFERQLPFSVSYKGCVIGDLRLDLLVEQLVVVEIKSVERIEPLFGAQILRYLKISGKRVGLLINFNSRLLRTGIQRFIL